MVIVRRGAIDGNISVLDKIGQDSDLSLKRPGAPLIEEFVDLPCADHTNKPDAAEGDDDVRAGDFRAESHVVNPRGSDTRRP